MNKTCKCGGRLEIADVSQSKYGVTEKYECVDCGSSAFMSVNFITNATTWTGAVREKAI